MRPLYSSIRRAVLLGPPQAGLVHGAAAWQESCELGRCLPIVWADRGHRSTLRHHRSKHGTLRCFGGNNTVMLCVSLCSGLLTVKEDCVYHATQHGSAPHGAVTLHATCTAWILWHSRAAETLRKLGANRLWLDGHEVRCARVPVPAGKEHIFPGCICTSAETCQEQRIWRQFCVNDSQASSCMVCNWAALVHQVVCSKLGPLGKRVP